MDYSDLINGLFELVGSAFVTLSIIKTYRDKEVKGINWLTIVFFEVWGMYNLYFYPAHDLWLSFIGGCFIMTANIVWIAMLIYYSRKGRQASASAPHKTTKQ